jgi:hypothetical protein
MEFDAFEDFDDGYDDDFDLRQLSNDYHGDDEWGADEDKFTARRKIERRRDLKKLYSQLDEWEELRPPV